MNQLDAFLNIIDYFRTKGQTFPYYHIANSAATFRLGVPNFNLVRIGIMGYGLMPRHQMPDSLGLKPVISWKSRVIFCKQVEAGRTIGYGSLYTTSRSTQIVTVPVGYADGYLRSLTNKGIVIINGKRYPVAGRVAMDHFMVDVGPDATIAVVDEVVLAGRQGDISISFEELADLAGTIPYEIVTSLGKRAYRAYSYSV
jgi:alanine racemase